MFHRTRNQKQRTIAGAVAVLALVTLAVAGSASAQEQSIQSITPKPTVPEVFTLLGEFVRVAYNNEGYATLGYRLAQDQVDKEWMMLLVGVTVRKPTEPYTLTREALSITTPDGAKVSLATQQEYAAGGAEVRSLTRRAQTMRDSINYFPLEADRACALQFFADPGSGGPKLAWDSTELSWERACVGRLYFRVPGGIKVGQHWLNIQFAGSSLEVPFRILTKEEEKEFRKTWKDIKKQHEAGYKK